MDKLIIDKDVPKVFIRICEECWMPYGWKVHDGGTKPKYCKQCQYLVSGRTQKGLPYTFERICLQCNTPFMARRKFTKYCSSKCAQRFSQAKMTVRLDCAYCGKPFMRNAGDAAKTKYKKRIYCDRECMWADKIRQAPRSKKWGAVSKWFRRFNRMKCCSRCGYDEETGILIIHHKDRNRDNNELDNLEVLCPNCHSLEHLKENKTGWKHKSVSKAYLRMLQARKADAPS